MRRSHARLVIAVAACATVAIGAACNAISGVGDLGTADECTNCDASTNDASTDDEKTLTPADAAHPIDAAKDAPVIRPSFCSGIVLYAAYDGVFTTAQGAAPDMPPSNTFDAGKFDSGVVCTGAAPAIYYTSGDGGVLYPEAAGSIAVWFKPNWAWPSVDKRTFTKATSDRTNNVNGVGPQLRFEPTLDTLGFVNPNPDGGLTSAASTATSLTPYWKNKDWNHMVGTWTKSPPLLTFTLNGASGDPTITHRETTLLWLPQVSAPALYTRLASNLDLPDGMFDDFAMWNRVLSLSETQALYGANTSIGTLCGL